MKNQGTHTQTFLPFFFFPFLGQRHPGKEKMYCGNFSRLSFSGNKWKKRRRISAWELSDGVKIGPNISVSSHFDTPLIPCLYFPPTEEKSYSSSPLVFTLLEARGIKVRLETKEGVCSRGKLKAAKNPVSTSKDSRCQFEKALQRCLHFSAWGSNLF